MEAVDQAEIITNSDSGYFGVDLSAPNIVHNNPLTEIDENTTSPSINANFTDVPLVLNTVVFITAGLVPILVSYPLIF